MKLEVKYRSQTMTLILTMVEGLGPKRDWLEQLQLDWKTIGLAMLIEQSTQIAVLKVKYSQVYVFYWVRHNASFQGLFNCKT